MRYRTILVDTAPGELDDILCGMGDDERLHSIVSFNQGGGYTARWLIVIETTVSRPNQPRSES